MALQTLAICISIFTGLLISIEQIATPLTAAHEQKTSNHTWMQTWAFMYCVLLHQLFRAFCTDQGVVFYSNRCHVVFLTALLLTGANRMQRCLHSDPSGSARVGLMVLQCSEMGLVEGWRQRRSTTWARHRHVSPDILALYTTESTVFTIGNSTPIFIRERSYPMHVIALCFCGMSCQWSISEVLSVLRSVFPDNHSIKYTWMKNIIII